MFGSSISDIVRRIWNRLRSLIIPLSTRTPDDLAGFPPRTDIAAPALVLRRSYHTLKAGGSVGAPLALET